MEITDESDDEEDLWKKDWEKLKGNTLIASINIGDRFQNKIEGIKNFLMEYNPAILFLDEVHSFQEDMERLENIFSRLGYRIYSNYISREKIRREQNYINKIRTPKGGIVVITSGDCNLIKVVPDLDCRCLKVFLRIGNENICIFGVYAPSACEPIEIRGDWWKNLSEEMERVNYKKILIGDLNVHLIEEIDHKPEGNSQEYQPKLNRHKNLTTNR